MKLLLKLFYDIETYEKCLKWGFFKTLTFLIFLAMTMTISAYVIIYNPIKIAYSENIDTVKNALANIKISDGKVQQYTGEPIKVKDKNGQTFAIISSKTIDANDTKNLAFSIEGKRLSIYQDGEEMSFDIDAFDFTNQTNLSQALPSWSDVKYAILPLVVFAISLSITIWHSLMLGAFAYIIDIPHKKLRLFNCIKLAILALTPASLISLGYSLMFHRMLPDFAVMIISAAMLYYIVINLLKKTQ